MDKPNIRAVGMALLPALCLAGLAACSKASDDAASATETETASPAPADYAALAADAAQVEAGRKLFSNCGICHSADPDIPSPAGPQLAGIVGRQIGSVEGFPYSQALKNAGGNWTPEALDAFLENPMAKFPGTTMAFGGLSKADDREAIIAYLASRSAD